MTNAQAGLIAAAIYCASQDLRGGVIPEQAREYREWLDKEDTLAAQRQAAGAPLETDDPQGPY